MADGTSVGVAWTSIRISHEPPVTPTSPVSPCPGSATAGSDAGAGSSLKRNEDPASPESDGSTTVPASIVKPNTNSAVKAQIAREKARESKRQEDRGRQTPLGSRSGRSNKRRRHRGGGRRGGNVERKKGVGSSEGDEEEGRRPRSAGSQGPSSRGGSRRGGRWSSDTSAGGDSANEEVIDFRRFLVFGIAVWSDFILFHRLFFECCREFLQFILSVVVVFALAIIVQQDTE